MKKALRAKLKDIHEQHENSAKNYRMLRVPRSAAASWQAMLCIATVFGLDVKILTMQHTIQLKGRQVKKLSVGLLPRVEAVPSMAAGPNQRLDTDLAASRHGKYGRCHLPLVIDCSPRELLGWHLSPSGKSRKAESELEHALISRFGCHGRELKRFLLRSDKGLALTSRSYTALVKSYGLQQESIVW